MKRRTFIKNSLVAASAVGLKPALAIKHGSKKVIVVGAGLAGLTAGYELKANGYNVVILESQNRIGGRVLTVREPFLDGLHAQAGGTAFWAFEPDIAMDYIKKFNLKIVSPSNIQGLKGIDFFNNQFISDIWNSPLTWNSNLESDEQRMTLTELNQKYINPTVEYFLKNGYPDNPSKLIQEFDTISVSDFLTQKGASAAAIQLLLLKNFDFIGKSPKTISTYYLFSIYSNFRLVKGPPYLIEGGNDLLPKAFGDELKNNILLNSNVIEINQLKKNVIVQYSTSGKPKNIEGDYVVVTVPFPVLQSIKVTPAFSERKYNAITGQEQLSTCPVFIQTKSAFWKKAGYSGNIQTDLPFRYTMLSAASQYSEKGLLEFFINSQAGEHLSNLDNDGRIKYVIEQTERILPGLKENFEVGFSKSWINDPYALGCSPYFRVGEVTKLYPYMSIPEGRIYFAGTHTASLKLWSYMHGAIESGQRVTKEIIAAE